MNVRFLPLVLLASCAPASAPVTDADRDATATQVRAASLALVDAMSAHEPDSILSFYRLDPGFVYVGCTEYLFGGEAFSSVIRGYHVNNPDVRYDAAVRSVRVLGPDVAMVSLQGTSSPDVAIFTTRVLGRGEDGRWRVEWEHESWPGCSAPTPPHPGTAPGDTLTSEPGSGT